MAEMTLYTRTTLIDGVDAALKSRKPEAIFAIQDLLKIKCNQHNMSWLTFLVDEALPAINLSPKESIMINLDNSELLKCPYCSNREFKSIMGLNSHLGKKHHDKKANWSREI